MLRFDAHVDVGGTHVVVFVGAPCAGRGGYPELFDDEPEEEEEGETVEGNEDADPPRLPAPGPPGPGPPPSIIVPSKPTLLTELIFNIPPCLGGRG